MLLLGLLVEPVSCAVSAARMVLFWYPLLNLGQLAELCPGSLQRKHSPSLRHRSRSSGVILGTGLKGFAVLVSFVLELHLRGFELVDLLLLGLREFKILRVSLSALSMADARLNQPSRVTGIFPVRAMFNSMDCLRPLRYVVICSFTSR